MNVVKGNLPWCKSLKRTQCVLRNIPFFRELSLSSRRTESVDFEEPSFGLLSSDPKSKVYENKKKLDSTSSRVFLSHERLKLLRKADTASDSSLGFSKNERFPKYSPKNAGRKNSLSYNEDVEHKGEYKKWQYFKNSEDENVQKISQILVEDDDEDEFYQYLHNNPEVFMKNKNEKKKEKLGNLSKDSIEKPFGTLTQPEDRYEDESGDEGDDRQKKYEENQLERRHTSAYYGFQMKKLCKENKLADALKILKEEMPAANVNPDRFCYQVLINACGRAGYTKLAFKLYNQMKKRALKPQPVTYTGLFNACANSPWPSTDGLKRAQKLRRQLQEKQYPLNQIISHCMIKAFGRCGDIKTAFLIVDEMLEQGLIVDRQTINFMLQACISDHETGFRHALMVWRKMRELRLNPDIYTYNLLVRCISDCKAGHQDLTSQLLEDPSHSKYTTNPLKEKIKSKSEVSLMESGIIESKREPSKACGINKSTTDECLESSQMGASQVEIISRTDHIEAMKTPDGNSGIPVLPNILGRKFTVGSVIGLSSLDLAENRLALVGGPAGLIDQMLKDKVKPDMKTVTQLLDSLPASSEVEEALLQSMKNIELEPDTQFFNMLIHKRCYRGDNSGAKDVLELMQEYSLLPDLITFGCLALSCKTMDSAAEFLKNMDASGFRPNLEIMTILVKNSVVRENFFFTHELLKEMHHRGVVADEKLMTFLENARNKARKIMLKMETSERKPTEEESKKLDYIKIFLLEYKMWLRKSDIQLDDHPWAQYNYNKASS